MLNMAVSKLQALGLDSLSINNAVAKLREPHPEVFILNDLISLFEDLPAPVLLLLGGWGAQVEPVGHCAGPSPAYWHCVKAVGHRLFLLCTPEYICLQTPWHDFVVPWGRVSRLLLGPRVQEGKVVAMFTRHCPPSGASCFPFNLGPVALLLDPIHASNLHVSSVSPLYALLPNRLLSACDSSSPSPSCLMCPRRDPPHAYATQSRDQHD